MVTLPPSPGSAPSPAISTLPLGVEHFGQTGSIDDLYAHFGIDADSIVEAASRLSPGREAPPLLKIS